VIIHNEDEPPIEDVSELAELAEEITRRIEAGESSNGDGKIGRDLARATAILELLPTLHAIVATGQQMAREDGGRARTQRRKKGKSS
jgi:hypothetical protein